jgi:hypothetical protein
MPKEDERAVDLIRYTNGIAALARSRRIWTSIEVPYLLNLLRQILDEAPLMAEAMGYDSGDAFIKGELEMDPKQVRALVKAGGQG